MKILASALPLALLLSTAATATDLDVAVTSGGNAAVTVAPGTSVSWTVTGELSDALSDGLAYFSFDLEMTGAVLSPAATPAANPILNFAAPAGLTNPGGFGGTPATGKLIQIGGAQNTINSGFAPAPSGVVITNVGQAGSPVVLASGTLTAPGKVGSYQLKLVNLDANVIRQGETGVPFWKVDPAGTGTVSLLTVNVSALSANIASLSIATAGSQVLSLDAGPANAGRQFWMLGSVSGTVPGLTFNPNVTLPLNPDLYLNFTIATPNSSILANSLGVLDGSGKATSTFNLPTGLRPAFIGTVINHAYILVGPTNFASDARSLTLTP